jgi:Bax protein
MKKILFLAILVTLSACINKKEASNQKEASSVSIIDKIQQNKPISVIDSCSNCDNPKNLKAFFDSIDYESLAKTDSLIISKITKNLFKTKDLDLKKEVFFKSIYPLAYKVNSEVEKEKEDIALNQNIDLLMKKYKAKDLEDLKLRVNTIKPSIILAQSAIESAYGTSRFAIEGNSLFGQWTKSKEGMIPRESINSIWRVAKFNTPLESARSYIFNINTNSAYKEFRKLRAEGKDYIPGLSTYSKMGVEYIDVVNSVIKNNNLKKYDQL